MKLPKCWNNPAFPNIRDYADDNCGATTLKDSAPGVTVGQWATMQAMNGLMANLGRIDDTDVFSGYATAAVRFAIVTLLEVEHMEGEADEA
ncbi:MAG: hypothetical protein U0990_09710 [Candidatus Nanopelagicales bacterium]|nr:hypothetical protein [Candidatus Nanopelagicales bacterium]